MIAVCFLLITSCWGNLFHLKSKEKIDNYVEQYRNYTKTNSINLDQIKVREMIMYFTSSPEELQEPFRMNLSGRFSFIHLLFSMECGIEDFLFEDAWRKLFKDGTVIPNELFTKKDRLGMNVVHLALKYGNQTGIEKIKACAGKYERECFTSADIIGVDPFMVAASTLAFGVIGYSSYSPGYLRFLSTNLLYMFEKRYFLNSEGDISRDKRERNFLMGSIFTFTKRYRNVDDIEHFILVLKFLFGNLLSNLDDRYKILRAIDGWEGIADISKHCLLKSKIKKVIEEIKLCNKEELDNFIDKSTSLAFIDKAIIGKDISCEKRSGNKFTKKQIVGSIIDVKEELNSLKELVKQESVEILNEIDKLREFFVSIELTNISM